MPIRTFEPGYYHIYNRWFEKMTIFKNMSDFERFYKLVLKYLSSPKYAGIKILAYSFLPNHFHCVVSTSWIEISSFFGDLQNAYGKYFNIKYERKGQLFEWRFRARFIQDEEYVAQCLSCVNFNAVKHRIVENIDDYPWTSYHQITDKDKIEKHRDLILDELEL